ncbi:alpha-hydroxy acid oxidase [Bosea sp. BK604]|uniref:alpha-hydroxy acid oxidase n=1 Tax=Bosea sp. BK604 TaxID=2512180 RepID=UPI00104DA49D|nr:alpha-hydroxy acid oxidase [Bosea sp. BK604]TCR62297.1 L-lactate dehydrogenase (cytochrome)/(S)-mandelate dehydrogenase [Bosea sp. BK604]
MSAAKALNIAELHRLARRRLPRILFDCIESGTENETALSANEASFARYRLMPRHLVDVTRRDASLSLFGRRYAQPFGIGPTGFAGLFRPGADAMLARTAVAADIPFVLSGASVPTPETIAAQAPGRLWYHLYAAKDPAISADLMRRVAAAGVEVLVLTVDNPVPTKRERDIRNGFSLPLRLKPSILLEALTHPGWIIDYLRDGGLPTMGSWAAYAPAGSGPAEVGQFFRQHSPSIQTWDDLKRFREQWPGKLVLKGIQRPEDARMALAAGVDGLIVSNHGGKAYDMLPIPLFSLAAVKDAVAGRIPVMFDGGIRRGSDILIARALGADFVFVGRATLYGVVAGGQAGADRAVEILRDEVDRGLGMIGCPSIAALDARWLTPATPASQESFA